MTATRRLPTRRDLPALCLLYSVIVAAGAIGLSFAVKLDLVSKSDLQPLSGTVEGVFRTNSAKAGLKIHILVRADTRLHDLTQDDLSQDAPQLMSLRAGEYVTALVRHDSFGRDLDWLWELQRDGATLLSYDQTRQFFERRNENIRILAHWVDALSLALFVLAILLKWHFGVWREKRGFSQSVSANAPIQ